MKEDKTILNGFSISGLVLSVLCVLGAYVPIIVSRKVSISERQTHELVHAFFSSSILLALLASQEIEIPWPGEDEMTAIIEILDDATAEIEATELWPGIGVRKDGFVPVGGCAIGTGDPFFINVNDGPNGPLYQIDHERVGKDGYDRSEAVEVMLEHYQDLLEYTDT